MFMNKLSVVINTKNAAKTLAQTLESVKDWAEEIVVVDMKSTDETVQIARKFGAKVYEHQDVGYVEPARNFATGKAKGDWILILDADEEVGTQLKKAIQKIIDQDAKEDEVEARLGLIGVLSGADAYYLARKNMIFGKWIEHTLWWPDYQLRLFKKSVVDWPDEIHAVPVTKGEVRQLPAKEELAILHHNYATVSEFVERMNRYTGIQAETFKNLKSEARNQKQILNPKSEILNAFFNEFLTRYFAGQGYQDGLHGLSLSLLQAMYQSVAEMKSLEDQGAYLNPQPSTFNHQIFRKFQQDLNYWLADYQAHKAKGLKKLYWQLRRKFKL